MYIHDHVLSYFPLPLSNFIPTYIQCTNMYICTIDNQKEQTFKRLWLIVGISLENLNECSNRCEMFLKLVVPPQTFMFE